MDSDSDQPGAPRSAIGRGEYQRLFAKLPEGVVVADVEGRVLATNDAFRGFFGADEPDLVGRPIEDLMPAEEILKLIGFASYLQGKDLLHDLSLSFSGANGRRVSVVASVARLLLGGGERFVLVGRLVGAREEALAETTRWAAAEQDRADEVARARDALAKTIDELQRTQSALLEASERATRANQQLETKVAELERMERELRLAQRLEAVGRLSAGVAHEINTPVQFVGDSLHFLREAYDEVRQEVRRLTAESADPSVVDLPYLDAEVPRAFEQAGTGIARIASIVRAMKTFSSDGRSGVAAYDLNRGLETALELSRAELKQVADVVMELGEIPPVRCRADEMNTALLNVIVNAAHAMQDAFAAGRPKGVLSLRTRTDGDCVVVSIQDTGTGIPDDVKDRIFDLFFTTKEVGRGTGQGLSMVWSAVVDNLGGQVWVDTEPGVGSTFHLRVPIG